MDFNGWNIKHEKTVEGFCFCSFFLIQLWSCESSYPLVASTHLNRGSNVLQRPDFWLISVSYFHQNLTLGLTEIPSVFTSSPTSGSPHMLFFCFPTSIYWPILILQAILDQISLAKSLSEAQETHQGPITGPPL